MTICNLKYRPEIDGLRALAITLVLGFHFFPSRIGGGFIGVDIFFVISGFLITRIIVSQLNSGIFSIFGFYEGRAKRLLPALLFVLILTGLAGFFLIDDARFMSLGKHLAGGIFFASNILLSGEAGYFDNDINTKFLAHLWSLGIEEQFYILLPIFFFLFRKISINSLVLIFILFFFSLSLNIYLIDVDKTFTFYSILTRMWELVAGSLIALLLDNDKFKKFEVHRRQYSNFFSTIGLVIILVSVFSYNENILFPGWAALPPVIGTIFLILSGNDSLINKRLFSNKLLIMIGKISYPLYLVHWPILTLTQYSLGGVLLSRNFKISLLFISVFVAWLIFRYIEAPVRYGFYRNKKYTLFILAVFSIIVFSGGILIYKENGYPGRNLPIKTDIDFFDQSNSASAQNCLAKFFPKNILSSNLDIPDMCSSNTLNPEILLIGDSHAGHYYSGLIGSDLKIAIIWNGGCYPGAEFREKCSRKSKAILNYINNSPNVKLVLLSSYMNAYLNERNLTGSKNELFKLVSEKYSDPFFMIKEDLNKFLSLINPSVKFGILYDVPELDKEVTNCKSLGVCMREKSKEDILNSQSKQRALYNNLELSNIYFFDPLNFLCDKKFCYSQINSELLYRDTQHLNYRGAIFMSKPLVNWISDIYLLR